MTRFKSDKPRHTSSSSTFYSLLSTFSPKAPYLALGGIGLLLIILPATFLGNVCLLIQYEWFSLSSEVLFAAVVAHLTLMGIGLSLLSLSILWSVRRW